MKYKDLIQFEPIKEVVKFSKTSETVYQKSLVKSFVFSDPYKDALIPLMVRNIDFNNSNEAFGLQVVGNYGTGKSHLMSLVSLIAEDASLLDLVSEQSPKEKLAKIAGNFKVLRFELSHTEELWTVITYKIENFLNEIGVSFSFEGHGPIGKGEVLKKMMAAFEKVHPDKGFLVVIDEMLAYLKSRSTPDKLNMDLVTLQALGQACDESKFKFIFGVQEMIYHSPEFQFAADMLQKVNDRYKDIQITKEDVAFIVKKRLLGKNEHQKQAIRNHLDKFLVFFTDMHARTQDYVELFPVHPSYFENFERIRIGKSQREILKTLSYQFEEILEQEVPVNNPGLLTYDRYWKDIQKSQDLMAIPDVRRVKEVTDTIQDKIASYFTGARAAKADIANRIANACAIKILQHELNKQNGSNREHLVDDLCLTDPLADDREFLIDIMDSTAKQVITATSGQYFDQDTDNGEFHLRIEGGINFDQKIKEYAKTMGDSLKDEYFFKFLEINLPLDHDTYRTGFKIWSHSLEWKSHKTYRDGYIFFGNPNERSTTHPKQHFYLFFMPIFEEENKKRNHQEDEVYFVFDQLSEEFRDAVTLFGAAQALEVRSDTTQKAIYRQKINELNKKARALFNEEYVQACLVDYQGKETPLGAFQLPPAGATKEQLFSDVASAVFEDWFHNENPDYPKFNQLNAPIAKNNVDRMIRSALSKIANPERSNRDGEGILSGLGLWVPGQLDYQHSRYGKSILEQMKSKGAGKVLNRDEILDFVERSDNLWISRDYGLEAELEFVVLSTLSALGEIEITLHSGNSINSTNLDTLLSISKEDYYSFTHIKPPRGINLAALKVMFTGIVGKDLSAYLKDPETYVKLKTAASDWAARAVTANSKIRGGFEFKGIELITFHDASNLETKFTAFSGFCDKLANYTSEAKIRHFPFDVDQVKELLKTKPELEKIENLLKDIDGFKELISYLSQSKQYIMDESLMGKIDSAIKKLPEVIKENSASALSNYKDHMINLKEQYAQWYLDQYLTYRISEHDHTQKIALLDSEDKAICDMLKEADFLSTGQYMHWLGRISRLKAADSTVNKNAVLVTPYHDFNPHEFNHQSKISIKELKEELTNILELWEITLKGILDDPSVKAKMSLLKPKEQKLLSDYKAEQVFISIENAQLIRNALLELHKGLDKIEIDTESMKPIFNKPLSPDEAIEAFKQYIDEISRGKERDKIRIILK